MPSLQATGLALSAVFLVGACTNEVQVGGLAASTPWSQTGAGLGPAAVWSLALDPEGNSYIAGVFRGAIDFGGGVHSAVGTGDNAFVASYARDGSYRWSRVQGASELAGNSFVTVVGNRVYATGFFLGTLDFEGLSLNSGSHQALLIWAFDRVGRFDSVRQFSGEFNVQGKAIRGSRDGQRLVLSGNYVGAVDFGGGSLPRTPGVQDFGFVAVFSGAEHRDLTWARAVPGGDVFVDAVVVADDGGAVASGWFEGTTDLGQGAMSRGGLDGFVSAFDTNGQERWTSIFGGPGDECGAYLEEAPDGDLIVAGTTGDSVDFRTDPVLGQGNTDALIARYRRDGSLVWSRVFGGPEEDGGEAVAIDAAGRIYLGGSFRGRVMFGGNDLESEGGTDIFVVAIDPDGTPRWARRIGGPGDEHLGGLAVTSFGEIVVAGQFEDSIEVAGAVVQSSGATDVFVHRFLP